MRLVLLCASLRGLAFLQRLAQLVPGAWLAVASFPEEPWEPPYFEPIREAAAAVGARFVEMRKAQGPRAVELFGEGVDLVFAVGWRYLLPPELCAKARLGAYAFHDSLLPRYRGFSPSVWALLNGEQQGGVSLLELAPEVDAGPLVDQQALDLGPDETIAELVPRTTALYLDLLGRNLPALLSGTARKTPQDEARATFCCKRLPEDNRIDWSAPAQRVHDLVRAVSRPYPGAFTTLGGETLTVWGARRLEPAGRWEGVVPGRVVRVRPGEGVEVLAGDGPLLVTEVQRPGAPPARADELLRSFSLTLGR